MAAADGRESAKPDAAKPGADLTKSHLEQDQFWMSQALLEARKAEALEDVPIGALVIRRGEVIGRGYNRREIDGDPLAHAEIIAIRQASDTLENWRLTDCTMYVTLEPCAMCAGALVNSRVDRLVFGASDPKAGFCGSLGNLVEDQRLNHRLEVVRGVLEEESSQLLKSFFKGLRARKIRERQQEAT